MRCGALHWFCRPTYSCSVFLAEKNFIIQPSARVYPEVTSYIGIDLGYAFELPSFSLFLGYWTR